MTPLNEVLTRDVDPRAIEAGWERVRARREKPRARRFVFLVPAVAVAALLVLVLKVFVLDGAGPQPIALAGGAPLPEEWSAPAPKVIALDDGSKLEIDAQAKLRRTPKKTDPTRVELTLDSGATTFDVKPGGPRMWVIDAGDVVVRVLGTRFTVAREGATVDVKVERGKVSVEGARVEGGAKLLLAGESIHVSASPSPAKHAAIDPKTLPSTNEAPPTIVAAPSNLANATNAKNAPAAPANRASAPSSLGTTNGANGPVESAPITSSPNAAGAAKESPPSAADARSAASPAVDPMASADTARRAGRPRDAVSILSNVVETKDARSPLAAFTLGKIHAEDLGDHATAAVWFERAIAFGLPRGLDEEAQARAVESHAKAGRRIEAARAAARYEASFPNGRHLERVRSFVRN